VSWHGWAMCDECAKRGIGEGGVLTAAVCGVGLTAASQHSTYQACTCRAAAAALAAPAGGASQCWICCCIGTLGPLRASGCYLLGPPGCCCLPACLPAWPLPPLALLWPLPIVHLFGHSPLSLPPRHRYSETFSHNHAQFLFSQKALRAIARRARSKGTGTRGLRSVLCSGGISTKGD